MPLIIHMMGLRDSSEPSARKSQAALDKLNAADLINCGRLRQF